MKLLRHTVKSYLIYSALVLLIAIPIFYFIIQALCLQDVDEALVDRKMHLESQLKTNSELLAQLPWHDINNTVNIYPPIAKAQEEKKITLQRYNTLSGEKEPFREFHTFIKNNGQSYPVILRISLINIEDLIQGIVLAAILLMILILGGLLWINRQQSKKIWQPFYQALNQMQHFTLNKEPDLRFTSTDISEFRDLQRGILRLTGRTYKAYLQQKEFTANAAHEMQTPLAAFQARLEVLMQNDQLNEEQSAHIQALGDSVLRMSKLNKGLLLLSKIENKQFGEMEEVQVVPVIRKILKQLEIQIHLKKFIISEAYQDCSVKSSRVLMDILFSNLLNNAVQHTPMGGTINVFTFSDRVEISNTGSPLPFSEEKLFHRFQKGEQTLSSNGNGLGLAIVKQICDTCHYVIHYQYKDDLHKFTLDLKKA